MVFLFHGAIIYRAFANKICIRPSRPPQTSLTQRHFSPTIKYILSRATNVSTSTDRSNTATTLATIRDPRPIITSSARLGLLPPPTRDPQSSWLRSTTFLQTTYTYLESTTTSRYHSRTSVSKSMSHRPRNESMEPSKRTVHLWRTAARAS